MNEQELESLVVRLMGDIGNYQSEMAKASEATQETADEVEKNAKRIEKFGQSVQRFGQGLAGMAVGVAAAGWLKEALGEWQEAENQALKLSATLRANGRDVDNLSKDYREFASSIQEVSVLGDDSVIALLRVAETFGLTGKAAKDAVRNSIALSGAVDGTAKSAQSYLRFAAAMEKGDIEMAMRMARMIPQLRGITDETKFLEEANRLLAGGMGIVSAEAESSSGRIEQLQNAYGDFMEEIGQNVAAAISPVISGVREVVRWFQELPGPIKTAITFAAGLTVAVTTLGGAIAVAGAIFNLFFGGIGILIGVAVTAIAALIGGIAGLAIGMYGVEEFFNDLKETVKEFWDNTKEIRQAIGSLFEAIWDVAKIVWGHIRDFILGVFKKITGQASIDWKKVKDFIVDAILRAEFTIKNFEKVANSAWLRIKANALEAWDDIKRFFTGGGPSAEVAEAWKRFNKESAEVQQEWLKFRADKLAEFGKEAAKQAEQAGKDVGKKFAGGAASEMQRLDAVLRHSLDAFQRIEEHNDRIRGKLKTPNAMPGAGMLPEDLGFNPVSRSGGGGAGQSRVEGLLASIRDILRNEAGKPAIELSTAGLGSAYG